MSDKAKPALQVSDTHEIYPRMWHGKDGSWCFGYSYISYALLAEKIAGRAALSSYNAAKVK